MSSWQLTGGFLSSFDVSDANTISLATLYNKTPTAAQNADAVWDEVLSGHLVAGTTGAALNGAGGAGDPWSTSLPGAYTAGQAGYILGTNLDATVASRASQASLDTLDDYVDTEVSAIKAKTDNLPADPASAATVSSSFTTVNSKLDTIDDYLDTEIAAIKAKTDTIPTSPAAVSDIPTANQNATAILDLADGVETNRTLRQALRLILSAVAGKLSGAGTNTVSIKDSTDTKTRIIATVDSNGNRTAITYDDT